MNWKSICRSADRLFFRQYVINQCKQEGGAHMSQATMSGVMNGVDVERLGQPIQAARAPSPSTPNARPFPITKAPRRRRSGVAPSYFV
ncbi:MAG: hypothetical protein CV089_00005, partial [Nitrospira sp. WS110]|nr:hypothetical protein [Nitrospira sp. WS110]